MSTATLETKELACVDRSSETKSRATQGAPPHVSGMLWFAGWLFTIGFAKLVWWKAVLALVVWPYYLGDVLR